MRYRRDTGHLLILLALIILVFALMICSGCSSVQRLRKGDRCNCNCEAFCTGEKSELDLGGEE